MYVTDDGHEFLLLVVPLAPVTYTSFQSTCFGNSICLVGFILPINGVFRLP